MKAKSVNEVQNFERGLDPKKAMDIGVGWKLDIKNFMEGLQKLGLKVTKRNSQEFDGVYEFWIKNFDPDDEAEVQELQVFYTTKAAAKEEGWDLYGFSVADQDGVELVDYTTNVNQVIRWFAKRLFGTSLKAKIIAKQKELDKLKGIQEYLDSITLPYLR